MKVNPYGRAAILTPAQTAILILEKIGWKKHQSIQSAHERIGFLGTQIGKIVRIILIMRIAAAQISLLFTEGFVKPRDKALFGVGICRVYGLVRKI